MDEVTESSVLKLTNNLHKTKHSSEIPLVISETSRTIFSWQAL